LFGGSDGRPAKVIAVVLTSPMGTKPFSASNVVRIERHARRERVLMQQDCVAETRKRPDDGKHTFFI
jgi:hypothetical protein